MYESNPVWLKKDILKRKLTPRNIDVNDFQHRVADCSASKKEFKRNLARNGISDP